MENKIKIWYTDKFKADPLGKEISDNVTFDELYSDLKAGKNIYKTIGVYDSIVRERLFNELAKRHSVEYDTIFNMWMNSELTESLDDNSDRDLYAHDDKIITYVNKNQFGYSTIAIMIDKENKKFQLIDGMLLPWGTYKKASKKKIYDLAKFLTDSGYERIHGSGDISWRYQ